MKMKPRTRRLIGVTVFTLLFPATASLVQYIPNPMVPGAIVGLNIILPVLAGYFYGPLSGAVAGGVGTLLTALWQVNVFYAVGAISLTIAGAAAGWSGKYRSEALSASTIILAHALNILFLTRLGLLVIPPERVGATLLGLAAETVIDIVAIVLIITLLKERLYQTKRW
ncbi:MAG: hypothetical protein DRJ03_23550 [Chloroflexi bacterium]|nr:MAG: hypothetical protein DRJ03_23550 [Chloroflexota bacterium]